MIMKDVFKNKLRKYNKVSDIVSDLVNYRIIVQSLLKSIQNTFTIKDN